MNRILYSVVSCRSLFSDSAYKTEQIIFYIMAKRSTISKWSRYWRLTIIEETEVFHTKRKKRYFNVFCDCGNKKIVSLDNLKSWEVKSCGCLLIEKAKVSIKIANLSINNITHWMSWSSIYNTYFWINDRCKNINNKRWNSYGWRWIKCEWNSFEEFYADMNDWYEKWLEIDRIDVNWNYCKENCRWVTAIQNSRNKQNTIWVEWLCLSEYCKKNSLNYKRIHARLRRWISLIDSLY